GNAGCFAPSLDPHAGRRDRVTRDDHLLYQPGSNRWPLAPELRGRVVSPLRTPAGGNGVGGACSYPWRTDRPASRTEVTLRTTSTALFQRRPHAGCNFNAMARARLRRSFRP